MSNKQIILDAARELFNRQGTAHVTTNYIAEQATVSPGNLYYHFKDKGHIIRALYEQMIVDWDEAYQRIGGGKNALDGLQRFVEENFQLLWRYRFFYREMAALLHADQELNLRHTSVSNKRFEYQRAVLQGAAQAGILSFRDGENELDDVLTMAWIVANHYLNHLETMGKTVERTDFENGARLVMKVFSPYFHKV